MIRYGSVCSGIEAATVAWHPLGWQPQFFSEIEAAPRAVLSHHYPQVPLHGDFTTIQESQYGAIDLLVGGTPCQSFSVAGLRGGLADDRGNLALQYLRLAQRLRPRWLVWENVPGVLSSSGGRDFGAILGGMVELGYGFAYRVLDAQYVRVDGYGRAVPQRRRRVFVVGYLGDWRRAAAVLLERASLRGDLAPRREAGTNAPVGALAGVGPGGGWRIGPDEAAAGQIVAHVGPTLPSRSSAGGDLGTDFDCDGGLVAQTLRARDGAKGVDSDCTDTLVTIAHSLRAEGFDASEDGTGRGTPIIPVAYGGNDTRGPIQVSTAVNAHGGPHGRLDFESETFIAFDTTQITSRENRANPQPGDPCHPLSAGAHAPAIAFNSRQDPDVTWDRSGSLGSSLPQAEAVAIGHNGGPPLTQWAVRRLTPTECERLQGFPDSYTAVPWRGGIMPDGPRYKALGNSMAVNCMRWIGRRIEMVENL